VSHSSHLLAPVLQGVYYATKGSFWAAALLHWLVITPYASLLSGWESLHTPTG
jgi:predicted Abi (CAAX) family protease